MTSYPTGAQFEISAGDQRAVVTEVGATLRAYRVGEVDLVHGFGAEDTVKGGRGQQLLPWPNRLRDGRYTFNGTDQQLWLTEPVRHNASHGLARYVPWRLVESQPDAVTMEYVVYPQPGWAGTLQAQLRYAVGQGGLAVTVTARNIGSVALPFGYGAHPYLSAGEDLVDDLTITIPADRYLEVDDRLLPAEVRDVTGTDLDWRTGRVVGATSLDTAFTDLTRDADGHWSVEVALGARRTVLWGDETMRWTQVFTGGPHRDWSVAVEPMTCGPDAFNDGPTHDDLIVLQPDEVFTGRWGITTR